MTENIKYFTCSCSDIAHVVQFKSFDDEGAIYCSLIIDRLHLRKRLVHFFKYLFKKQSFNDYYSGLYFPIYCDENGNEVVESKELISALNEKINPELTTPKYFSAKIDYDNIKNSWYRYDSDGKRTKYLLDCKRLILTNDRDDINSLTFMNEYDKDNKIDEQSLQIILNRNVSVAKRLLRGLKYLFGKCSNYGVSEEFIITKEAAIEIKKHFKVNNNDKKE